MKYKDISFQTLANAFRHHWKAYLLIVVLFTLAGIACGVWYAPRAAVASGWEVESLADVNYSEIQEDAEYYSKCIAKLSTAYANADQYLTALSDDGTITKEQRAALTALRGQLNILKSSDYKSVQNGMIFGTLYLPKASRQAEIENYEGYLASARFALPQAEAAAELIRNMDAPDVGTDEINATYSALLTQAQRYTQLQREIPLYEEYLRQLREDSIIDENCRKMDRLLKKAADHLNDFHGEITETAEEIAEENALRLEVSYGAAGTDTADTATITLSHTHRAASGEEAFAVMTLFCALVGICGGAFFTLCLELYGDKRKKD